MEGNVQITLIKIKRKETALNNLAETIENMQDMAILYVKWLF